MKTKEPITLALTGASGAQYALRLLEVLVQAGHPVYLLISKAAQMVLAVETDLDLPAHHAKAAALLEARTGAEPGQIRIFGKEDWMSPVASGSGAPKKMVVCPCSTGTLSAIAQGASDNLIERAADVVIKEKHQLILVVRETPLSSIHLRNMLTLSDLGVVVLPASPGFYHQPESIDDLVDFVVARVINQLGIEQNLLAGWGCGRP